MMAGGRDAGTVHEKVPAPAVVLSVIFCIKFAPLIRAMLTVEVVSVPEQVHRIKTDCPTKSTVPTSEGYVTVMLLGATKGTIEKGGEKAKVFTSVTEMIFTVYIAGAASENGIGHRSVAGEIVTVGLTVTRTSAPPSGGCSSILTLVPEMKYPA